MFKIKSKGHGIIERKKIFAFLSCLSLSLVSGCSSSLSLHQETGLPLKKSVASWKELKFKTTVRQRQDFTCGAASLATLFKFFYGKDFSESFFLKLIESRYTKEEWKKVRKAGMSLDDLAWATHKVGFKSAGAKMGLSGLLQLKGPVIVHLDKTIIEHFVVLKGISGDRVFLSDPIVGDQRISIDEFLKQYTGSVFAIWEEGKDPPFDHALKIAKGFNPPELDHARDALFSRHPIDNQKPL